MTASFIQITDLHKDFHMGGWTIHAISRVSLTIEPNTFTVIMGPSGSGKSTLLYLLGGLDRPTSGQININGQNLETLDENDLAVFRRKTVGFIYQSFNLIPSMTALQNVAFPLIFTNIRRRDRLHRAEGILKSVGLEDRARHRPTELSGGQQQRVAIARALVNDPQLILADEPTGNLDTASGSGIMHLLAELHQSGRTVLVVSHDLRMKHFATQCIYLLDGQIVNEDEYNHASSLNSWYQ